MASVPVGLALRDRFGENGVRDLIEGFSRVVDRMADMKVELLRWSFAFWIGQIAVIMALLSYMLRN